MDAIQKQYNHPIELQLALIRIYIGIDFIHHFAEKFGLLGSAAPNSPLTKTCFSIKIIYSITLNGKLPSSYNLLFVLSFA